MRLTISLDDDLYGLIKALAKSEDTSMSDVVNGLVRRVLEGPGPIAVPMAASPWPTIDVRPGVVVHPDEAQRLEAEEDARALTALGFKK